MERVSIREASLRLRMPTSSIRQCISDGELKAHRQTGPNGRQVWVVEMPEEGWVSAATAIELDRPFSPWWWAEGDMVGSIHYVEVFSTGAWEELSPKFLCGFDSLNVWLVKELVQEQLCPECLTEAKMRDLPLS